MMRTKQIIPQIKANSKAPPKKTFFKVAIVIVNNRKNDEILVKNPRAINTEPNDSERDAKKPKKT